MDFSDISKDSIETKIELQDFTYDESHPYANNQEVACYETLRGKSVFDKGLSEHVYTDVENDVYENTKNLREDSLTGLKRPTRDNVENEYTSIEAHLDRDSTYDNLFKQGKERESEIYNTIGREDETLKPESVIGVYRNLKYVRTKRLSCLRRRWKLLLLLAIVLLVSVAGVITAVILVTNEEDPVEFTENFETPMDIIEEGCGSGSGEGEEAELEPND